MWLLWRSMVLTLLVLPLFPFLEHMSRWSKVERFGSQKTTCIVFCLIDINNLLATKKKKGSNILPFPSNWLFSTKLVPGTCPPPFPPFFCVRRVAAWVGCFCVFSVSSKLVQLLVRIFQFLPKINLVKKENLPEKRV